MINAGMKNYNFATLGAINSYGQLELGETTGVIKMAIYFTSETIQNNINYSNCRYIGLTQDQSINDTYVITYEGKKLKVQTINPQGRYKQVFLTDYE